VSHAEDQGGDRRDFLYFATGATGLVTVGAGVWPLVNQMNPSADVQAASSMRVDVSDIPMGTQIELLFLGKPVFIRRRTPEEVAEARAVDVAELPDDESRNENAPDTDASDTNRTVPPYQPEPQEGQPAPDPVEDTGEWLVMFGSCTHLGCVPVGNGAGDFNGWFCPCHGSHYDTSGRIRSGPAPENLPIPPAVFVDETTILLG
jgi:ubiquinol-cytochrome c reductase iron-sulfur subunit